MHINSWHADHLFRDGRQKTSYVMWSVLKITKRHPLCASPGRWIVPSFSDLFFAPFFSLSFIPWIVVGAGLCTPDTRFIVYVTHAGLHITAHTKCRMDLLTANSLDLLYYDFRIWFQHFGLTRYRKKNIHSWCYKDNFGTTLHHCVSHMYILQRKPNDRIWIEWINLVFFIELWMYVIPYQSNALKWMDWFFLLIFSQWRCLNAKKVWRAEEGE